MHRRRFLSIAAAMLAAPAAHAAEPAVWTGRAMGAAARVVLHGAGGQDAVRIFARIERTLAQIDGQFSLHRDSALTRLNRDGRLAWPGPDMAALVTLSGQVHSATGGAFDPTIQPLWLAAATGGDTEAARRLVGWHRVRVDPTEIRLDPGMALTFNGVAQGHAADRIADLLRGEGYGDVLVDMGEIVALGRNRGRAWQAEIDSPDGTPLGRAALSNRALATSSPFGTRIGNDDSHILDPRGGAPRWSTVSVSAGSAAVADALSTAFCILGPEAIDTALGKFPDARIEAII